MKGNDLNIAVIGSGFAGLASAAVLSQAGCNVSVFEKNDTAGGRARTFEQDGFLFDMGPSWYWMPDVFERFYQRFGHTTADFYELKRLDPGFSIIFGEDDVLDVPDSFEELCALFESLEQGAAARLIQFMDDAAYKYAAGMDHLVYQPCNSILEFCKPWIIKDTFRLQIFSSFRRHVRSRFRHPKLVALLEFPVLFLGATPADTPALYSLMNYAGLKMGTFYPMGGFGKVVEAFKTIAEEQGAAIAFNSAVDSVQVAQRIAKGIMVHNRTIPVDAVIGAADYHHIEQQLLQQEHRNYSQSYWDQRKFAPSCLIFYIGVAAKLPRLQHHNLFFDADIDQHAYEIYTDKKWPSDPLFYVCCPSKTDTTVAPEGCENMFVLMPIATELPDNTATREEYYIMLMDRLERHTGVAIREKVTVKKSYSVSDFVADYNACKGNAYGLANTLTQTAILKPKLKSKKVDNLFFAGQLTVPGPGVPPSIISGQVAAAELLKSMNR